MSMGSLVRKWRKEEAFEVILERDPLYNPLLAIYNLSKSVNDPKMELECHRLLAEYLYPKVKPIEPEGQSPAAKPLVVNMNFSPYPMIEQADE